MVAVGALPSEFVQEPSLWLRLESIMFPALFAGVVLALLGLVLAPFTTRSSAISCVAAAGASMVGVTLAWGIDAEAGLRGLVFPIALLTVPLLGAVEAFRQVRREYGSCSGASLEESAG
jgi:hypothetical protein